MLRGVVTLPDDAVKEAVIFLHGFERAGSTESKFKHLADTLSQNGFATLRFDFSGCGLSDGDFRFTNIEKQWKEFLSEIAAFQEEFWSMKLNIVTHSLGACALAEQIENIKEQIAKMVLIAPALDQARLLRYRFVSWFMKKTNLSVKITWNNYEEYFDEELFLVDCNMAGKMSKRNFIDSGYFLMGKDNDYSQKLDPYLEKILHVHGDRDVAVPLQSISNNFPNQIIVSDWDHDMERPDQIGQWLDGVVGFFG